MAKLGTSLRTNLFLASLLLCGSLHAQAPDADGMQVFSPDYFASSKPADAFDMVRKLPGFELIEVDDEVRGFTGSRGNVLVDGQTPSSKQETLEQMLRRIPASSVLKIELIRGGAAGSATGGYDLVANIVRRKAASSSLSALAGISAADGIGVKPDFRFELSRQANGRGLDGAVGLETDIDDDSGRGTLVERNPDGVVTSREDRNDHEVERTVSANAEYEIPLPPGEMTINLNASRARTSQRIRTEVGGVESLATEHEQLWSGETGAQYSAEVWSGEVEALAVQRLGRLRSHAQEDDERFTQSTRTGESIGRIEYRRGSDKLRMFGSLEAAFNKLTSDTLLTIGDVDVPISGSDVKVVEKRAEGAFGAVWTARPKLIVEPSMRTEISNIRSSGDSPQNESFLFVKPRLRASWENGRSRIQATIEREAAQLDFEDFVASAELDRDDVIAGAVSLRPSTTWFISATFEQRFWGDGVFLVTLRNEWIDDVIDQVVVDDDGELFDAVGNIGKGKRRIARVELTAPLHQIGLAGVQMRAALTFLHSRVTDPVTGERRIISEDVPFEGELRFTHDIPGGHWSYGIDAALAYREKEFRFDEVIADHSEMAVGAYLEHRPNSTWRLRLEMENLTSRRLKEERTQYDGLRSSGDLESVETRRLRTAPIFIFSVRRSFGAPGG